MDKYSDECARKYYSRYWKNALKVVNCLRGRP